MLAKGTRLVRGVNRMGEAVGDVTVKYIIV